MSKYFGDKKFYINTLTLVIPIIIQNLITNFVSMLDNIMVGQLGTCQMNGVSIINQYIFIFNISVFGCIAGPSIFGSQFFGRGDTKGQRDSFRFRLLVSSVFLLIAFAILTLFPTELINLFISPDDSPQMRIATLSFATEYMWIIMFSLPPFIISQVYSSTLRECGNTKVPMYSSLAAVIVNLVLDYALIFGELGCPRLGVAGAAIATAIAKLIEACIVVFWVHIHAIDNKYIIGAYKSFKIAPKLFKEMTRKSLPLLFNEILWVIGISATAQCFSVRGLDVVAARNIAGTITNLFGVVYIQLGTGIGLIVGSTLGAGKTEEAIDEARKLRVFSIIVGLFVCICMLPFAWFFPDIYNTQQNIRHLAGFIIIVHSFAMPLWAYSNACYFELRSGGQTFVTFLFDFVFTWVLMIPLTVYLSYFTTVDIHIIIAVTAYIEIIKTIIGYYLTKSRMWVKTIGHTV